MYIRNDEAYSHQLYMPARTLNWGGGKDWGIETPLAFEKGGSTPPDLKKKLHIRPF